MHVPVGVSDFYTIVTYYDTFVDKSLLIKEFVDSPPGQVQIITRPRRHGKTFALSMLQHFMAEEVNGKKTKGLFNHLLIAKQPGDYIKRHQGQYPVVFLTLKGVKESNFENAQQKLSSIISDLYTEHVYLLASDKLLSHHKKRFERILNEEAALPILKGSLHYLTQLLYHHFNKQVIVLIDEYDTPLHEAYLHSYVDEMVDFMRGFLGEGLKDNSAVSSALITGILKVAKENLFSDLNNVIVYTPLDPEYAQYFGFTQEETKQLFDKAQLNVNFDEITAWYNGYTVGSLEVYNPWSVMNCIKRQGKLRPYWINTSENQLIRDLIRKIPASERTAINELLQGKSIQREISINISLNQIDDEVGFWSLLLMAGYLKVHTIEESLDTITCSLSLPNFEVRDFYRKTMIRLQIGERGLHWYRKFIEELLEGNVEAFVDKLKEIVLTRFTLRELRRDYHEAHYQGFVSGLLATLSPEEYDIKQQGEGRDGYYDIAIIPKKDKDKFVILFEFKAVKEENAFEQKCQQSAEEALQQIDHKGYALPLERQGFKHILKLGIAFSGKQVAVCYGKTS